MRFYKATILLIVLGLLPFVCFSQGIEIFQQDESESISKDRISEFIISFEHERNYSSLRQVERENRGEDFIPVDFDNPFMVQQFPSKTGLLQNYPNPFSPLTNISYTLEDDYPVTLEIFNSIGSKVATLIDGELQAGHYNILFDGSSLNTGVYVYRLETPTNTYIRRMLLI